MTLDDRNATFRSEQSRALPQNSFRNPIGFLHPFRRNLPGIPFFNGKNPRIRLAGYSAQQWRHRQQQQEQ